MNVFMEGAGVGVPDMRLPPERKGCRLAEAHQDLVGEHAPPPPHDLPQRRLRDPPEPALVQHQHAGAPDPDLVVVEPRPPVRDRPVSARQQQAVVAAK